MEDLIIPVSTLNLILIIIIMVVFFVMAANVSKIKRKVTESESRLRRDARMYEFIGEKDEAIKCYKKVKFIIQDERDLLPSVKEAHFKEIDGKIESLQTKL